jgi:4a-hydroxytetrahydrobiopterin dehydratase
MDNYQDEYEKLLKNGWSQESNFNSKATESKNVSFNFPIQKTYIFSGFKKSIAFVNEVANLAELHNHHPDLTIQFNKVKVTLFTHDSKSLTNRDLELANLIDKVEKTVN